MRGVDMRKQSAFKSGLKAVFGIGCLAIVVKLILTVYYGYMNINAEYGGPFYYSWRTKYADKEMARSTYIHMKKGDMPKDNVYVDYVNHVSTGTEEQVKENLFPFYSYGFPDTFVISPKLTWTLFRDDNVRRAEFDFLKMRAYLIQEMNGIKEYSAPKEDKNGKIGLPDPGVKDKYFKEMRGESMAAFESKLREKVPDMYKLMNNFKVISKKIDGKERDYEVSLTKDSAKMSEGLSKDVMKLVNDFSVSYKMKGVEGDENKFTEDEVNGFLLRISTIKPTAMDMHILNRMYALYLYINSDVKVEDLKVDMEGNERKEYTKMMGEVESLETEIEGISDETKKGERARRMKNIRKKIYERRTEYLYNRLSYSIASILGDKGHRLNGDKDKRSFLEKFGNPSTL